MSNLSPFLLLAAVAGLATPATAALPAAAAFTNLSATSTVGGGRAETSSPDFGTHQAVLGGGQARASLSLGADGAGVPFIAFSAAASGHSYTELHGTLSYQWVVQGAPGSSELVPVTITSLGHIRAQVTGQALRGDVQAEASANWLGLGISNTVYYWGTDGLQSRIDGLESGNVNNGTTSAGFSGVIQSAPGGSVTARGEASFSETFTLMVYPNVNNDILMQVVQGMAYNLTDDDQSVYRWAVSAYLDPVITIDPAYASRFSVLQSDIPMVPVPEASTWAMLLAGLGLLAVLSRRRA